MLLQEVVCLSRHDCIWQTVNTDVIYSMVGMHLEHWVELAHWICWTIAHGGAVLSTLQDKAQLFHADTSYLGHTLVQVN